jgi:valyl-tRNA synthetase
MEKTYNPQAIEQRWYETWEQEGRFAPSGKGAPYCILIRHPMSRAACIWGMRSRTR